MPEPSSGSALGSIASSLLNAYTTRKTRANELEDKKELMTHGAILDVVKHSGKIKFGMEAASEAEKEHYESIYDTPRWRSKKGMKTRQQHLERSGGPKESTQKGIIYQAAGNVPSGGEKEKAKTRSGGKNKPTGGGGKGKGQPAPTPDANLGNPTMQYARGSGAPTTPTVNETATPVKPANTGNRRPRASKGGYAPRAPKEKPGSYKDTSAAVKGGHITPLDAIQISPTFARKYASKVEGAMMEGENK